MHGPPIYVLLWIFFHLLREFCIIMDIKKWEGGCSGCNSLGRLLQKNMYKLERNKLYQPWTPCMVLFGIGILLSYLNITIEYVNLGKYTMFLGSILIVLSGYQVIAVNASCFLAFVVSASFFLFRCVMTIVECFILQDYDILLGIISAVVQYALIFLFLGKLRDGMIEGTTDDCNENYITYKIGCIRAFVGISMVVMLIAAVNGTEIITIIACLVLLAVNLCMLVCVWDIGKHLRTQHIMGMRARNDLVKVSAVIVSGLLLVCALQPVIGYYKTIEPIKETFQKQESQDSEIVAEMKKAGFPQEIIDVLTPEEILNYKGIQKTVISKSDKYEVESEDTSLESDSAAEKENTKLTVTLVYSYFDKKSDNKNRVRVLAYGKWDGKPSHQFTDQMFLLSNYREENKNTDYGIYTDEKGNTRYYPLTSDSEYSMNQRYGNDGLKGYVIPRKGKDYRFIVAENFVPYSEEEEIEDGFFSLVYYHRINFPRSASGMKEGFEERRDDYELLQF